MQRTFTDENIFWFKVLAAFFLVALETAIYFPVVCKCTEFRQIRQHYFLNYMNN